MKTMPTTQTASAVVWIISVVAVAVFSWNNKHIPDVIIWIAAGSGLLTKSPFDAIPPKLPGGDTHE